MGEVFFFQNIEEVNLAVEFILLPRLNPQLGRFVPSPDPLSRGYLQNLGCTQNVVPHLAAYVMIIQTVYQDFYSISCISLNFILVVVCSINRTTILI